MDIYHNCIKIEILLFSIYNYYMSCNFAEYKLTSVYNCTISDLATALCNAAINTANIEGSKLHVLMLT